MSSILNYSNYEFVVSCANDCILNSQNQIKFSINHLDLPKHAFKIRVLPLGSIYNSLNNTWVNGAANWVNMPYFQKDVTVKLDTTNVNSNIYFEILDTKTGKTYKTNYIFINGHSIINLQTQKINTALFNRPSFFVSVKSAQYINFLWGMLFILTFILCLLIFSLRTQILILLTTLYNKTQNIV